MAKFNRLTLSLEKYDDLLNITLDEVIGSLTVHELQLKEHESWEEEQALLTWAINKANLHLEEPSSRRRGGHHGSHRG